jgi:hypothetical protein
MARPQLHSAAHSEKPESFVMDLYNPRHCSLIFRLWNPCLICAQLGKIHIAVQIVHSGVC